MAFNFKKVFSSLKGTPTAPSRVVGIDFGSSSVKVVELEQREGVLALTTYGELQLGPYADTDMGKAVNLEPEKRVEALVDVLRESNVTAKAAVMALPLASSFVTIIKLNAQKGEDISPRVRVEARKHIPVPIGDVTLDWIELANNIETKKDNESVDHDILVAAIQNESLAATKKLMTAVNFGSQPNEIELFSSIRAITKSTDDAVAIIDIGSGTSKMYIAKDGLLRQLHRVGVGGTNATKQVATLLGVSFTEAEELKRNYNPSSPQAADIKKAFVTSFEKTFQEFKRLLDQYEQESGVTITRTVLCGGSSTFVDMPQFASYMLDRQVVRANPFTKVAYPAFMEDTLKEIAPTFTVALGCALRAFEA